MAVPRCLIVALFSYLYAIKIGQPQRGAMQVFNIGLNHTILSVEEYRSHDGLVHKEFFCLVQGSHPFLFIGSQAGVKREVPMRLRTYRNII